MDYQRDGGLRLRKSREEQKDYDGFVEGFKPKKKSDEHYTPPAVYEVIKNWVLKEYKIKDRPIIRPFYPGGDYENYDYPKDCVVIDNPPFSILKSIKDFYTRKGIDFFLFAPSLTLISPKNSNIRYIITNSGIIYESGLEVNTSFITNLGTKDEFIRTAPELKEAICDIQKKTKKEKRKLPKYIYPKNVISSALLGKISKVDFKISQDECYFITALEDQKKVKKKIFGDGYLISDKKAEEFMEKQEEAYWKKSGVEWKLSDEEKEIIKTLGKTKE